MPSVTPNRVGVIVYFSQDTYHALESLRSPKVSKSVFCATVIEEALGITSS